MELETIRHKLSQYGAMAAAQKATGIGYNALWRIKDGRTKEPRPKTIKLLSDFLATYDPMEG